MDTDPGPPAQSGFQLPDRAGAHSADGRCAHRADTFKLSTDAQFIEKVADVVGLYHHPPEQAVGHVINADVDVVLHDSLSVTGRVCLLADVGNGLSLDRGALVTAAPGRALRDEFEPGEMP